MRTIKLGVSRWREYKQLKLRALKEEPQAFSSNYEESINYPHTYWKDLLEESIAGDIILLFAQKNGELIGMAGAIIDKEESSAEIISVYVVPEERHKGVASKLISTIIEELQSKGIEAVHLYVRSSQSQAMRVYEKLRFETNLIEPADVDSSGVQYQYHQMLRSLV